MIWVGDDSIGRSVSTFFVFCCRTINLTKNPLQTSKSAWVSDQPYKSLAYFLCFIIFLHQNVGGYNFKYWKRWHQIIGGMFTAIPRDLRPCLKKVGNYLGYVLHDFYLHPFSPPIFQQRKPALTVSVHFNTIFAEIPTR